jgi:lipoprotein-anchoring transpeptidase ErfK/SrfK
MRVPGGWYGRTSVLPVVSRTRSRLQVRPARRLYLFRNGQQLSSYPVGVGVPATPTPTGSYFLAFHAPPNGPGYGPVMLETSAHSTAFTTFEGGNDAIIAIHGPIDSYSDSRIGTVGAALSNGCIRMHNSDLVKVARAPDGTPIVLVH